MRKFMLRLARLAGVVLTLGACADSPTGLDQQHAADLAASAPDTQVEGCVTEGICTLPPISGGGCDEWDYSCDGGGDCAASAGPGSPDGTTVQGCDDGGGDGGDYDGGGGGSGGGGGGGGSGGTKGPLCPDYGCEDPAPDPCFTGDPKLDDPNVYSGFQALWTGSNYDPDIPQDQRRERAGWLVQDASGYRLVEIMDATFHPCGVDIREAPPAGAVGVVHTHPWKIGEVVTTCASGPVLYTGTPSEDDKATLRRFGLSTGYILDASGIGQFTGSGGETALRKGRCGY
jgi:hypothetical protein